MQERGEPFSADRMFSLNVAAETSATIKELDLEVSPAWVFLSLPARRLRTYQLMMVVQRFDRTISNLLLLVGYRQLG